VSLDLATFPILELGCSDSEPLSLFQLPVSIPLEDRDLDQVVELANALEHVVGRLEEGDDVEEAELGEVEDEVEEEDGVVDCIEDRGV